MQWAIYDRSGQRKYLTQNETRAFLDRAERREPLIQGFCWILAATGCRISEALSLKISNIDFEGGQIVIESLKKRGRRVFRAIPIPHPLLRKLKRWLRDGLLPHEGRLWPWSRMTGYRRIREVMQAAGIVGAHASPKGLRHGFGIRAIQSGVPLNLVQRWLGHADIKTTAIYTSALGPEEREIASRMWRGTFEVATRMKRVAHDIADRLRAPGRLDGQNKGDAPFLLNPVSDSGMRWLEDAVRALLSLGECPVGPAPIGEKVMI